MKMLKELRVLQPGHSVSYSHIHLKVFIIIIAIVIKTLVFGEDVQGYPTIVCAIFFVGGLQLFCIGILGQYLSKTYLETKQRPVYLIKETEQFVKDKNEKD